MGVFHVFKLYKWYQIMQRITYDGEDDADNNFISVIIYLFSFIYSLLFFVFLLKNTFIFLEASFSYKYAENCGLR